MSESGKLNRAGVAKGLAWSSLATLVSKLIFPLVGLYVTRKLGPGVNGDFALLTQLIALADVIRDGGLTQTYLVEKDPDEETERQYNTASFVTGLVPVLLILAITPSAPRFFRSDFLWYGLPLTAFAVACQTLTTMANARMLRRAMFRESAILNLALGAGSLALCVILVSMGVGVEALLVQMVTGPLVGLVVFRFLVPSYGVSFAWRPILARLRRSSVLIVTNLINNLFLLSDVFFIQRWLGAPFTGYYNYARNIGSKPAEAIVFPLSRILMVAFSQDADNPERLRSAYARAMAACIALVIPIFLFMIAHAEPIVLALGGPAFAGAIPMLRIVSIYLACRSLGNISGNTLVPLGHHRWTLIPWIAAVAVTGYGMWSVGRTQTASDYLLAYGPLGFNDLLGHRIAPIGDRPELLGTIAWWYVAGAAVAYGWIVALAIRFLAPGKAEWARLARAALACGVTGAFIFALRFAPGPWWLGLVVAMVAVPLFHLTILGTIVERRPLAFVSPRGVKRLWHTL